MAVTYLIEDREHDLTVAYFSLLADKITFNPEDALSSATRFYEKNGFKFFTELDKDDETRLMFYDLKNFIS